MFISARGELSWIFSAEAFEFLIDYFLMDGVDLVSIIIPVFNAERYLEEAISSALNQIGVDVEVIVVDDGSSDHSIEIIKQFETTKEVSFYQHAGGKNLGVSKTRQLGLEKSVGNYISFLDADDVFEPNKSAKQIEVLRDSPECVLCHAGIRAIGDAPIQELRRTEKWMRPRLVEAGAYSLLDDEKLLAENHICNSTVLIRTQNLKSVSFATPQLFQHEDWLLWSLLSQKGNFHFLNEPLVQYRIHDSAFTSQLKKSRLTKEYSHLEFLLTLACLSDSEELRHSGYSKSSEVLSSLMSVYLGDRSTNVQSSSLSLGKNDPALLARLAQLEGESVAITRQKKCLSYQLVRVEAFIRRRLGIH